MALRESRASAPGKVILFGEHAVVYHKPGVAASVGLRTTCSVVPNSSTDVHVRLFTAGGEFTWSVASLAHLNASDFEGLDFSAPIPQSQPLKDSVYALMEQISSSNPHFKTAGAVLAFYLSTLSTARNIPLTGMTIEVSSHLPLGAGLGSSASFCVAVAAALLGAFGVVSSKGENVETTSFDGKTQTVVAGRVPSEPECMTINSWAFAGEQLVHGTPSGVDNAVVTNGGALVYVKGLDGQPNSITPIRIPKLRFMLVNTCSDRSTKALVAGVRARKEAFPSVMDHMIDGMGCLANEAVNAFQSCDPETGLGQLYDTLEMFVDLNQGILDAIGVGHPKLTAVCQTSARFNLHSKLTGAGGGGCAFTLLRPGVSEDVVAQVSHAQRENGFETFEAMVGVVGVLYH